MKIAYWIGRYADKATAWRDAFSVTAAKYFSLAESLAKAGHEVHLWHYGQPMPNGCDCVFVPCWTLIAALPLAQVGSRPVVAYMDGVYLGIMRSPAIRRVDLILTTTQPRADEWLGHLPDKRVVSVGYGTRADFALGQPSPYQPGTRNAVYVGRWSTAGHELLMVLARNCPDVQFWLGGFCNQAGKGMMGIHGSWLADIRAAPNVHLIGEHLQEQDLVDQRFGPGSVGPVTYAGSSAFVEHADATIGIGQGKPPRGLPDHYSLACKVYFYWMHGTPCLVEYYGHQSLLTKPFNGVVYDGRPAGAVAGLQKLLALEYDRKRIREWAVATVSWDAVTKNITKAMEETQ